MQQSPVLPEARSPEELLILTKKKKEKDIDLIYKNSIEDFQNCLDIERDSVLSKFGISIFLTIIILISFLLGRFKFSIAVVIGLIYAINLIYKRRLKKFKNSMKALIYRQTLKEKRKNNWESVEWMNYIITKVWTVIEPTISKEVLRIVNPILQEKCPPFLSKLKLTTFTLGSNPPFVVGISTFEETDPETIILEAEFGFVPLEMGKETYHFITRNKKYQWNSKIILVARLGTKVRGVGLDLPVLVKQISFQGRMRIILNLTQDKIIVKDAEVCFMEMPEIDFTLAPLKTVDLMDVPGLSNWIHTIINSTLKNMAVNPNSIKVDLSKSAEEKTRPAGVLLLRIAEVYNKENEEILIEIDNDGRKMYHTALKEGKNIMLNEYFYLLVENHDENINFKALSPGLGKDSFFGEGSIFLKKILELDSHLESVKIYKKGNVRSIINCSYDYFPIVKKEEEKKEMKKEMKKDENFADELFTKHLSNSAIVRMKILQADDVKGNDSNKKKVYSSCFTILVSPKIELKETEKVENKNLLSFVTGPVNATALLVGGAFESAGNFVGNIIPGQSKQDSLLPSSESTFYVYESKTIMETNSPLFGETCEFFSRDIKNDVIYFRLKENAEDGKVIGKIDIPVREIGGEKWYRLKDCQSGRIKIGFEVDYVNLDERRKFVEFDKAIKLHITNVVSIYEEGCFYCVIKTSTDTFYVEPFCVGDLILNREIIIPLSDDKLKIYVYKEGLKNDDYIGEGSIDVKTIKEGKDEIQMNEKRIGKNDALNEDEKEEKIHAMNNKNDEDEIKNISGVMSVPLIHRGDENGSLNFEAEYLPLQVYKGISSGADNFKTVQVKFTNFKNLNEEFIVEFISSDEVIQRSAISRGFEINTVFLLLAGKNEIRARFKSAKIGVDKVLGDCLVPKRAMNERIMLNDEKLSANMEIKVLSCGFKKKDRIKEGHLQLFIRSACNLMTMDANGKADPYVKIFLNGNRIHKTATKKETLNPVFNECINLKINSLVDILRIEIFDWNKLQQNVMIAYKEMPLYFLEEGLCDIDLHLFNAKTFKKDGSILSTGFMFQKKPEGERKTKFGGIKQ